MGLMGARLGQYATTAVWALAQQSGAAYGVDPALVMAVIQVESRYNPRAVNPSDPSYGLMQMLPATASLLAGRAVAGQELLDNPELAVDLGTQYLAQGLAKYGNLAAALAAYNAGVPRQNAQGQYVNSKGNPKVQTYVDTVLAAYAALSSGASTDGGPLALAAPVAGASWLSSPWTWVAGAVALVALVIVTD